MVFRPVQRLCHKNTPLGHYLGPYYKYRTSLEYLLSGSIVPYLRYCYPVFDNRAMQESCHTWGRVSVANILSSPYFICAAITLMNQATNIRDGRTLVQEVAHLRIDQEPRFVGPNRVTTVVYTCAISLDRKIFTHVRGHIACRSWLTTKCAVRQTLIHIIICQALLRHNLTRNMVGNIIPYCMRTVLHLSFTPS
jgi:hypothetical protein